MSKKTAVFFVGLYPLLTLLGIFLFFTFTASEGIHYLGFSSVMYSFLFALRIQSSVVSVCSLIWIFLFLVGSIATYVEMIIRKQCIIGFVFILADLIASIGFLLYIIIDYDYVGHAFVITGWLIRAGLFAVLLSAYKGKTD